MLAIRMRQKDSVFYLSAYRAADLLRKVQFSGKSYEGEKSGDTGKDDMVSRFFQKVQSGQQFFQRRPYARKVRQIADFFADPKGQPIIPGAVLLYTPEELDFDPARGSELMGNLHDPKKSPFLIIDGQHRLAGLEVLSRTQPDALEEIEVPCIIFDKAQADFAVEMFVLINSTPTRLNRSHLVDLYDRLQRATPLDKASARAVAIAYEENDSPLQRRIDMLGRHRRTERWIRQASLFREFRRLADRNKKIFGDKPKSKQIYEVSRDFLRAARKVFGEAWGNPRYRVTSDVTLMAMLRVLTEHLKTAKGQRAFEAQDRERSFQNLLEPWKSMVPDFREEGFYERFAARGQVERVGVIQRSLANAIGLTLREPKRKSD